MNWSADTLSAATKNPLPLGMGVSKAIYTTTVNNKDQPTEEQLNKAKSIINNAISEGYVLVPAARLLKLLETFCSEEIAKELFLELTK